MKRPLLALLATMALAAPQAARAEPEPLALSRITTLEGAAVGELQHAVFTNEKGALLRVNDRGGHDRGGHVQRQAPTQRPERQAPAQHHERQAPVEHHERTVPVERRAPVFQTQPPARLPDARRSTPNLPSSNLPSPGVPQRRPDSIPSRRQPNPVVREHQRMDERGTQIHERHRADGGSTVNRQFTDGRREQHITTIDRRTGQPRSYVRGFNSDGSRYSVNSRGVRTDRDAHGMVLGRTLPSGRRVGVERHVERDGSIRVVERRQTRVIERTYVHYVGYRGYTYPRYVPVYHRWPWWGVGPVWVSVWYPFYFHPWPGYYYYSWSWYPAGYYGWYYRPYPVYSSSAMFLTDYVVLDTMYLNHLDEVANEERAEEEASESAITETQREQIKSQVEEVLRERESSDTRGPELDKAVGDPDYLFMVHDDINAAVVDADTGQATEETCDLTAGDLIQRAGEPGQVSSRMRVVSTKGTCEAGSIVNVSFGDLQAMVNEFHGRLDDGLEKLKQEKENGRLSTNP